MSREFKIGDDVEWVRYGGLFGIDGFRCNGTIVGFGLIGEHLWCTVYCKNDKELYRIEAERLPLKKTIVDCYKCSDCGRQLMFSKGITHIVCPACGSEKLEHTTMAEMLNKTITASFTDEDN